MKRIFLVMLMSIFVFISGCKKADIDNAQNTVTPPNTFTDTRDGNVYKIITIGNQTWMAENLRYLPIVAPYYQGSTTLACYYVYGFGETDVEEAKATDFYETYGVLYNWNAAKTSCPAGWHLPSDAEWTELSEYLGGYEVAGGKLKEAGTAHWMVPNTGDNSSGFTALPGDYRIPNGNTGPQGDKGYWWTSTVNSLGWAQYKMILSYQSYIGGNFQTKDYGCSVRCIKD